MEATFEEKKQRPLMIEIESARRMIITSVNKARQEHGIPVFILEGIISDIHQQLSSESKITLLNDMEQYLDDKNKENEVQELNNIIADKDKEIEKLKKENNKVKGETKKL